MCFRRVAVVIGWDTAAGVGDEGKDAFGSKNRCQIVRSAVGFCLLGVEVCPSVFRSGYSLPVLRPEPPDALMRTLRYAWFALSVLLTWAWYYNHTSTLGSRR